MTTAERQASQPGKIPIEPGLVTDAQLERSLEDDRRTPKSLGHVLIDLSGQRPTLYPTASEPDPIDDLEEVDRVLLSREFAGLLQDFGPRDEAHGGRPTLEGP